MFKIRQEAVGGATAGESVMRNKVVVTALARIVASGKRSSTRLQPLPTPPLFSDVPIHIRPHEPHQHVEHTLSYLHEELDKPYQSRIVLELQDFRAAWAAASVKKLIMSLQGYVNSESFSPLHATCW